MRTRAVQLTAPGQVGVIDRHIPLMYDDQVLLKVRQAAVRSSDVAKYLGHDPDLPSNPGHEIAGEVIDFGDGVPDFRIGDHVVAWTPHGGGMANMVASEARYCVRVDPSLAFPAAADPLARVVHTVKAAQPQVGDTVVIVGGTGFMGLMLVQMSRLAGARRIIVSGRRPGGLERARAYGATHTVNTIEEDLVEIVRELTQGGGAHVAYELTGTTDGLTLAGQSAHRGRHDSPGGKVVIAGFHQGQPQPTDWGLWNRAGLITINAHFRPDWECMWGLGRAATLLQTGTIDPGPFVPFALDQVGDAFEAAARREEGFYKAVVVFED